jgi:peptide deformylase
MDAWYLPVCGIAANQIGLTQRMVAFRVLGTSRVMINPEIIRRSLPVPTLDVCASAPGKIRLKRRHAFVTVRYQDAQGKENISRLVDLAAFLFQQEMDHLDGRVIV